MAVPPVSAQPQLVFSGEGHIRAADVADAAAVVLGHEAGNLVNFQAIATARGGYVRDEQFYVRLGFVDGQLTVVGGTSSAVIVAPPAYEIPPGAPAPAPVPVTTAASAAPQPANVSTNVDLLSADGVAPAPAPPPETSVPVNSSIPAPPVETSGTTTALQTTDVSANLNLAPAVFPNVVRQQPAPNNSGTAEATLEATRQQFALAADQGNDQGSYLFASNIFVERSNYQYSPFAGLGRDPVKPFAPTEIPRLFVDGAY